MNWTDAISFFSICLVVSAIHSCKKVDEIQPNVIIISPLENTQFDVFDTVDVRFEVTDETQLVSAEVKIVNSDFIAVSAAVSINLSGTDYSGGAEVILANKLLETGNYYALVSVSDGVNEQRVFQKIKIAAIPKLRRAVYFSDVRNSGSGSIYKIDSLFQSSSLFINPSQDIRELCVNSELDRLTFIGHFSTRISSYNLLNNSVVWSDATFPVSQTPRFMDLFCYGDQVFTTLYDQEIRSYT
ncbi:MAG: hypothetical protein JKX84_01265, partial [Flavobacteriales bacterium]|nr:hypothetical protein [Flavobacteriales bacterium]